MSESDAEPKAESEPESEPEAEPESEPEAEPESEPESEPEPESDAEPAAASAKSASSWAPHPIVSGKAAYGLATLTGLLVPIGFAGVDIWPVSFIAWVPLLIALRGQTPKQALWLGWYSGFIMTMLGFYWLVGMLETFSGFPLVLCIFFAALLCIEKGGRMAFMSWLYARVAMRSGWHAGLSFLGAFAVSELVYPLLFTWYYAASVHNAPLFMQTADLGGPILVSLVLVAFNVAVAELFEKTVFKLAIDWRTVGGCLGAVVLAALYGFVRMGSVESEMESSESLKVGMVQGNSKLKGRRTSAVRVHRKRTEELRKKGVDLVVWSEAAMRGVFNIKDYERKIQQRVTRHLKVPAIVGGVLYERLAKRGVKGRKARLFNSAFITDEKGKVHGRYDKMFLLMFGEYIPLGDTFPVLYEWSPNSGGFSKGKSYKSLPFGEHQLATMICYEDLSPDHVNKMLDVSDSDLLVNMTNDAWFGDTNEPWQHLALAKFRSVEQRMYMVRVTNSGVTAIIDPIGRTPVISGTFTEEALVGDVRFMKKRTVYRSLRNYPWWLVTLLMAVAAFVRRKRTPAAKKKPAAARKGPPVAKKGN